MVHGDDAGLKLPPRIAPVQAVIVPIAQHKEGVLEATEKLCARLSKDFRVKLDDSQQSPGWKFAEYEMKGVPLRIEVGPRDLASNQCVMVTRHNREKVFVSLDELETVAAERLTAVRDGLYEKALANREKRTYRCKTMDEITEAIKTNGDGFVHAMWCGDEECEKKVKETTGIGSRCVPFDQEHVSDTCVCCGREAKKMVLWAIAY